MISLHSSNTRVWKSIEEMIFGKGDRIHYKRHGKLDSVEGKSNRTSIRFKIRELHRKQADVREYQHPTNK